MDNQDLKIKINAYFPKDEKYKYYANNDGYIRDIEKLGLCKFITNQPNNGIIDVNHNSIIWIMTMSCTKEWLTKIDNNICQNARIIINKRISQFLRNFKINENNVQIVKMHYQDKKFYHWYVRINEIQAKELTFFKK